MAVTPRGIQYPDGSTLVDFINALEDLASTADTAIGDVLTEVVTEDSGWQTPAFLNGWANFAGAYETCLYRKREGVVYLTGLVRSGSVNPIFLLPAGYRPTARKAFLCVSSTNGAARVDVLPTGEVQLVSYWGGGSNSSVSLAQIVFPADA